MELFENIVEGLEKEGVNVTTEMVNEIMLNVREFANNADAHYLMPVTVGATVRAYSTQSKSWLHEDGNWATFPESETV